MDHDDLPTEWLRAVLSLAVLSIVAEGETYGYAVAQRLQAAELGEIKGGTLYPLLNRLESLSSTELVDPAAAARALGLGNGEHLDGAVAPRGYRLLAKVPRLPTTVVDRLVEHFGTLQKLLSAGVDDLQAVEGVGELRARSVREGLSRLAESSILERYV